MNSELAFEAVIPSPSDDLKKVLRATAKANRKAALARHGSAAGDRLAEMGLDFTGMTPRARISGFLAVGDEIDVLPLMSRLALAGHGLCLPVIEGKGKPLVFRSWQPGDPMVEVTWGIREPLASASTVDPDVLLVPLLAFDARGYRLGYGGGFYDRSLARLRTMKPVIAIGVGYDEQRVDAVPHSSYDERLDWVLTPSGPLKC